jgi:hypothetical protein
LPLILDAHGKWAFEALSRFGNRLGELAPDNPVLRGVPHLELACRDFRSGDNFKIRNWHKVPDFQLALAYDCQGRCLYATNPDYCP